MAYGNYKDLARRTVSWKYDGYQIGIASMVDKLFNKKSTGKVATHTDAIRPI